MEFAIIFNVCIVCALILVVIHSIVEETNANIVGRILDTYFRRINRRKYSSDELSIEKK